ncbi:MAG: lamin tail domain-containing protein [Pirellulales bacterium]
MSQSRLRPRRWTGTSTRRLTPRRRHGFEILEDRLALAARPVITEFMADNAGALLDGDGNASDWIEVFNAGDAAADMSGWSLTDNPADLAKWPFPAATIEPGGYLVVFASGQATSNYIDAGGHFHTNFGLDRGGEYLALVKGGVVRQEFAPQFATQREDVSYGLEMETALLVGPATPLEYLVPTSDALEPAWRMPGFANPSLVTGGVETSSASVVLTELGTGDVDFVEIANVAGTPLDTSGWFVAVNNAEPAAGATSYTDLISSDPGLVAHWRLGENVAPQGATVTHGQAVIDRNGPDSFHGVAVFDTPLPNGGQGNLGRVTSWRFFNNTPGTNGRSITPLLLEDVGVDQYMVRGIGATRTVTEAGLQSWDFAVAQGTDTFDWTLGRFHMGIRYGSPTVSNPGVVEFSAGGNGWDFFGSATGAPNVVLNTQITGGSTFNNLGRDYSVQYTIAAASGGGLGDTAVDATGNHNGQYSSAGATGNKPGAIVGDANTAVDLAGGTVTVQHSAALDSAGGAFTVEAWVQPDAAGTFQWIVSKDSNNNGSTPGLDYLLGINPAGQFRFVTQGLANDAVAPTASTFDGSRWYHVVGVQDPATATVRLYVDGQLAATAPLSTTGVTSPADLKIGDRSAGGGGQKLDGRVDEVAIYGRALSASDVQDHYFAGIAALGGGVDQANPIVWPLPTLLAAGASAYRTDSGGDNYWGSDIRWNTAGPGWAMIVDDAGAIVDFAAWGYSAAELAGLSVRVGGRDVTVGSQWTGDGAAALGTATTTLQRQGDLDHDAASDFVWQVSSKGATNAGLTVPFQTTLTPLFGGIGYSDDGGPGAAGETVGPSVIDRAFVDGASGSVFLLDNYPFTEAGQVTEWSFYSTNTLTLTPLLFRLDQGTFGLVGVGRSRVSTGTGLQTYAFDVQSGSDLVGASNYYFGFKDGDNTVDNTGVIDWTDGTTDTIRWFGGAHAGDIVAGSGFEGGQTFPRSYSLQAKTAVSLGQEINTDIGAAMSGGATSLYVRYPFDADGPQSAASLALRIKYDDGFVAYLNGTEVARRNAPAVVSFNSVASSDRPLEAARQFEEINLSPFAGLLLDGANVLAIHGLNDAAVSSEFLVDAQLVAGRLVEPTVEGYFSESTPGGANATTFAGFVADTSFSVDRGFYSTPQAVEISTPTPGATIVYTTNGSEPTLANGTAIAAADANTPPVAVVNVSQTTTLRAAAFKADMQPTNVDTQTYIFIADVVNQGVISSSIRNHPLWGSQLADSLTAVPTISIVTPNTISLTEQETSVEMIFPDGTPGFQIDAGIEHYGGTSLGFAKKSMRLSFKTQYGPSKLRYPVFDGAAGGETATSEFDQILLRSGSHDTRFYTHGNGTQGIYIRNRWAFDRQLEMGQPAPHGRFVHVYINGTYWGQYDLVERPNAGFMEAYFGGAKEDYDALNAGVAINGDLTAWNAMVASTGDFAQLSQYLDIDNYVDYVLLNFYAGNDWDWNHFQNWAAARKREDGAGFQFFAWDSDMMLRTGLNANVINRGGPGNLWGAISQHPEVRQMLIDRAQKYFFNDGMLTRDRVLADFDALQASIASSIVAETARWGDGSYTPDTWQQNINRIRSEIINGRTEVVIQQLRDAGFFPSIEAPAFSINGQPQFGGTIDAGDLLSMSVPPPGGSVLVETPLITSATTVSAFVPTSGVLGDEWRQAGYVEGAHAETWRSGQNGVGYETGTGYESRIHINVVSEMSGAGGNNTVYVRLPFAMADQAAIDSFDALTLRVLADDGFVAFLNGVEVASANAPPTGLAWDSNATTGIEVNLGAPAVVDLTPYLGQLVVGDNVLAIHGLNASNGSSDMLIYAELAGGAIDATPVEADIYYTLDGSDPRDPGATVYAAATPLNQSTLVKARSFWNGEWSALAETTYTLSTPPPLVVTEIMYNPAGADDAEFIELTNVGSGPLDLAGFQFSAGLAFTFGNMVLPAGERVLVVRNLAAFEAIYGSGLNVAGEFAGSQLDNGGEQIALVGPLGKAVFDFAYDDAWYPETDGDGFSLVAVDTAGDYNTASNWRSSARSGGSPGAADPTSLAADFNGDGHVDRTDAAMLARSFGLATGGYRSRGDANGDGRVDVLDLAIVQSMFGQAVASAPAAQALLRQANSSAAAERGGDAERGDAARADDAFLLRASRRKPSTARRVAMPRGIDAAMIDARPVQK